MVVPFAKFSALEEEHMRTIVDRGYKLFERLGFYRTRMDVRLDLAAVHYHTPLDLERLADFSPRDFSHDLLGIYHNLNRRTGALMNQFLPKSAKENGKGKGR